MKTSDFSVNSCLNLIEIRKRKKGKSNQMKEKHFSLSWLNIYAFLSLPIALNSHTSFIDSTSVSLNENLVGAKMIFYGS